MKAIHEVPQDDPHALLERGLIDEYLRKSCQGGALVLRRSNDPMAVKLFADAVRYATLRLAEISSRSHYMNGLRGALLIR